MSDLTEWLLQDDKTLISSKLAWKRVDGMGNCVISTDSVTKGEKLISVPRKFNLNFISILEHLLVYSDDPVDYERFVVLKNVEPRQLDRIGEVYLSFSLDEIVKLSSFQLISMYLVLESFRENSFWGCFIKVLPDLAEFSNIPMVWLFEDDQEHFEKLPASVKEHAKSQFDNFNNDYTTVCQFLSQVQDLHIERWQFLRYWLCCNSRCLYMKLPASLDKNHEDNFTMVPYVDFLNHTIQEKCSVKVTPDSFQVFAAVDYQKDDQIYLSYGAHSNEFLLCEYGFVLGRGENKWNSIDVTPQILKLLSHAQIHFLEEQGYLGEYFINSDVSYRIEVALLVYQEGDFEQPPKSLLNFINGYTSGEKYQATTDSVVRELCNDFLIECGKYINVAAPEVTDGRSRVIQRLYEDIYDLALLHG